MANYSPQSPDIGQNSDRGISDFQIFGKSVINGNCLNSIASNDIAMKLGPVPKPDKKHGNVKKT